MDIQTHIILSPPAPPIPKPATSHSTQHPNTPTPYSTTPPLSCTLTPGTQTGITTHFPGLLSPSCIGILPHRCSKHPNCLNIDLSSTPAPDSPTSIHPTSLYQPTGIAPLPTLDTPTTWYLGNLCNCRLGHTILSTLTSCDILPLHSLMTFTVAATIALQSLCCVILLP